ncbi:MAG: hypothetical protein E6Q97_21030 [Desulfurellales bacterium]|nr:MAG: hypothetical protein E6Q97_21030 [Desulfurellales bacterium]
MNEQITVTLSLEDLAMIITSLEQRAVRLADRADATEDTERGDYIRETVLQLRELIDTLRIAEEGTR